MKWTTRGLCLVLALLCLRIPVLADSEGSSFADDLEGICLTALPESGRVQLGSRTLRAGDVLTAEQAAQMTFAPGENTVSQAAEVSYLPIRQGHVDAQATMKFSIRGKENQPPIAEDSAFETYKNLEVTNRLKVTEPEEQAMTFAVARQPKRGTVILHEDGSFTYTPKKNKVGVDSFTYTATDSAGQTSREATVIVTILRPSEVARYADTAGKDCCFAAEWMKNTGIFTGEKIGEQRCFGPEQPVTQGAFLTMLVQTLELPTQEELACTGYEDAPQWLKPYLSAAIRSGLIEHFPHFQSEAAMALSDAQAIAAALSGQVDAPAFSLEDAVLTRADAANLLYALAQQHRGVKF